MEFLFIALIALAVPFVLPIATWVSARRTRARLVALEELVDRQREQIHLLESSLREVRQEPRETITPSEPATVESAISHTPEREPAPHVPAVTDSPSVPGDSFQEVPVGAPDEMVEPIPSMEEARPLPAQPIPSPSAPATDVEAEPANLTRPVFDWEGLVGVKLFSAVAGIALVLAAIFFLRYSIEHGWLQPPVRVAIGVLVAVALLVVCELKAARRYPATANALDAAAVAILFATFFAAHALWHLIPAPVTFGLLALVTAVAVLLSIRRQSLFIAVLGLLGGFATPALLSTGENRPIPLFAYLLLLNIGLAWVARQRGWRLLTWMTLILTTLYQWGWVLRFLHESSLSLAMGVFILFPLASMTTVLLARRPGDRAPAEGGDGDLEQSSLISATLPLAFAAYLAAVPEYGSRGLLLFGFLLFIDLGLLAIALAQRQELLHVTGAMATLLTVGVWLAISYPGSEARGAALGFTAAFVLLYLLAPLLAARLGRRFEGVASASAFGAPLLLFALPVLARIEPAFIEPWSLFATLLLLVLAIASIAIWSSAGGLYYVASFFAVATQAVWSSLHLSPLRLGTAVAIYLTFAMVSLGVPYLARRRGRPLEPAWGGGAVLLLSLLLLLFLSAGPVAPAALWALALLLAILNAAVFVESAAGGLPRLSQAGTVLSWIVLANWWGSAAGAVGVMPSLTVLTGLTLATLGGHAWTTRRLTTRDQNPPAPFTRGLYLGLAGHLFLLFLALNREWALPPWPLFGALAVMTLATSAASLAVRAPTLHGAGAIAAAIVVGAWGTSAGEAPWPAVALVASATASAYALAWIGVTRSRSSEASAQSAASVLVVSEVAAIMLVDAGTPLPFWGFLALQVASFSILLALAATYAWTYVAAGSSVLAWVAILHWQASRRGALEALDPTTAAVAGLWPHLLVLAASLYAIFVAYPAIIGRRRVGDREPYIAAIVASAMLFFAARAALTAGDLEWMLGAVPVLEGLVLAGLLRQLLRLEPAGERDLGRLALVAGAALAFATVAIPVQLERQWVTIGWALEGAALAWLYRRVPHKGLLYACVALLGTAFARLALNPEVLAYEPRGELRILNWYLYAYLVCALCLTQAGQWLSTTDEQLADGLPKPSRLLPAGGVVLLFLLLNIEIADFYATEPTLTFRFGVTLSQDLTYTLGWLVFGMLLLAAGIYRRSRGARIAAVGLIAVTTFKCFLYDLGSLEGLYRVASFVGLAASLALVSLALQKYVLSAPRTDTDRYRHRQTQTNTDE